MIHPKIKLFHQQLQAVEQTEQVVRLRKRYEEILLIMQQQDNLEAVLNQLVDKYEKTAVELDSKISALKRSQLYS